MKKNENYQYPWSTCGTELDITGCRFSIAPMSDQFVTILTEGINQVDTTNVWNKTDELSTIYRGKRVHVLDGLKACFVYCYRDDVHMTLEATISKGCPGDTDGDSYLTADDTLINEPKLTKKHFPVVSKISFYPLGTSDYMKHIAYVVNKAIERGIFQQSAHYVSIIQGDVHDIFAYFDELLAYAEEHISHYVLQLTLSVNSPTKGVEL